MSLSFSTPAIGFGSSGGSSDRDNPLLYGGMPISTTELATAQKYGLRPKNYIKLKPMLDLVEQYEADSEEANQANEKRYQQGLTGWNSIIDAYRNWSPTLLGDDPYQYGRAQRERIEQSRQNTTAQGMSSLYSAGMGNTTLANSVQNRANRESTLQNMELDDLAHQYRLSRQDARVQQQNEVGRSKLDAVSAAKEGRLNWIQSKEDTGPDPAMFSQMLQMYAKHPGRFRGYSSNQYKSLFEKLPSLYGN